MKIIPSQLQISAENRHYKMANTFFLLPSLNTDQKMKQRIGEEFFSFYGVYQNRPKNTHTKRRRPFF